MTFVDVAGGRLLIANRVGPFTAGSSDKGRVDIYEWNQTAGQFILETKRELTCHGVHDVESFVLQSEYYIALACRERPEPELLSGKGIAFTDSPVIYKWNDAAKEYQVFQSLGPQFKTTLEDRYDVDLPLADAQEMRDVLLGYADDYVAQDGKRKIMNNIRGATGIKVFEADGGVYLAIGQSVCGMFEGTGSCGLRVVAQPKSTVLQWNVNTRTFEELQSFAEDTYNRVHGGKVPQSETLIHSYAFRMNAGRMRHWDFIQVGSKKLLLACSVTRGPVVYDWTFQEVRGLAGAVAVAVDSDSANPRVYALGRADAALAVLSREPVYDDLGTHRVVGEPNGLAFKSVSSELPLQNSATTTVQANVFPPMGLSGGHELHFPCNVVVSGGTAGGNHLCVVSRLSRDEYKCGDYAPLSSKQETWGLPAACQTPSFTLTSTTPAAGMEVFATRPMIDSRGALVFRSEPGRFGEGMYTVVMRDGAPMNGRTEEMRMRIVVVPVNDRPTFTVCVCVCECGFFFTVAS